MMKKPTDIIRLKLNADKPEIIKRFYEFLEDHFTTVETSSILNNESGVHQFLMVFLEDEDYGGEAR